MEKLEDGILDPNRCSVEAPRPCEVATGMGFMARILEDAGVDPSFLFEEAGTEARACRLMERAMDALAGHPESLELAKEVFELTFPHGCPAESEA